MGMEVKEHLFTIERLVFLYKEYSPSAVEQTCLDLAVRGFAPGCNPFEIYGVFI